MTVAKTILTQINAIDKFAMADWGALFKDKFTVTVDDREGLRIKSSGMVIWKGNIDILYDRGSDTYRIEFFKFWKGQRKVKKVLEDIYADMLVSVIDEVVLKEGV